MSSEVKTQTIQVGPGFCGLLTILFITLKLCGVIHWSWLWVLAPLWIGFGLAVILLVVALIIFAIYYAVADK